LDADADRLALYMATRAGYGLEGAGRFWERLAGRYPASTLNGYTALHPDTTSRMEAIERTTSEIRRKLAERKPLLP
jgi:predicted Zn-dependent protease